MSKKDRGPSREAKAVAFMRSACRPVSPLEIGWAAAKGEPWAKKPSSKLAAQNLGFTIALRLIQLGVATVNRSNQFTWKEPPGVKPLERSQSGSGLDTAPAKNADNHAFQSVLK